MPSFIHSTFSQPRSCSKNDWRIMQQNKFETRLGSKMFGRTQMEFRSCSGHVSNHQEWGQNPTGSLCICGISFGWILLCFYLHILFLLYIKECLEMLIFKMERYGIKDKFLIETGKIFFLRLTHIPYTVVCSILNTLLLHIFLLFFCCCQTSF